MTLLAPDEFRDELIKCSRDDIEDLRAAGIALHDRGSKPETIRAKLEEAGWSHRFSDWYTSQIELNGPNFEICVSRQSELDARMEEYRRACKRKRMLITSGWIMVAVSVGIRVVVSVAMAQPTETPSGQSNPSLALAAWGLLVWIASIILWFKGLWNVLDAKGQTRWWSLVGLFVVLVPDRNPLFEPRVSSSVAQGHGRLSDW